MFLLLFSIRFDFDSKFDPNVCSIYGIDEPITNYPNEFHSFRNHIKNIIHTLNSFRQMEYNKYPSCNQSSRKDITNISTGAVRTPTASPLIIWVWVTNERSNRKLLFWKINDVEMCGTFEAVWQTGRQAGPDSVSGNARVVLESEITKNDLLVLIISHWISAAQSIFFPRSHCECVTNRTDYQTVNK